MEKLEITQEEKNEITAALQTIYQLMESGNTKVTNGVIEQVIKINEVLEIEILM